MCIWKTKKDLAVKKISIFNQILLKDIVAKSSFLGAVLEKFSSRNYSPGHNISAYYYLSMQGSLGKKYPYLESFSVNLRNFLNTP